MSGQHARLAPSAAPVWAHCAGSLSAAAAAPERETDSSRRGDAGHWAASEVLRSFGVLNAADMLGRTAPNGVVICQQVVGAVQVYVDDIRQTMARHNLPRTAPLLVEHRVAAPQIHPDNWGTLDCALVVPEERRIYLWDLKLGHVSVPAVDNLQLANYMAGLVVDRGLTGADHAQWTTAMRIVQPLAFSRSGPIKDWFARLSDLRAHWNILQAGAERADKSSQLRSGPHCRYCPARGRCPSARIGAHLIAEMVGEAYNLDTMTAQDLAVERSLLQGGLQLIKGRLEAIEADLLYRISQGDAVPGLAVGTGRGRERFTVPDAVVVALCQQFGVDPTEAKLRTPKQVRDMAAPELRFALNEALKAITGRPTTGLQLMDAGDTLSAHVFAKTEK